MKNKDTQLLEEAYEKVELNEAFIVSPTAAEAVLFLANGNNYLAALYLILIYFGIPGSIMAWLSYDAKDIKQFAYKIWSSLRGKITLDEDKVESAANKAKELLKGPEKGRITRLVNEMKRYIEKKDMSKAQQIADELNMLIK